MRTHCSSLYPLYSCPSSSAEPAGLAYKHCLQDWVWVVVFFFFISYQTDLKYSLCFGMVYLMELQLVTVWTDDDLQVILN